MKRTILRECIRIAYEYNTPDKHPEWGNFHHYTFIVQKDKLISWATNKSALPLAQHGYEAKSKLHSETEAYRKARGILLTDTPFTCINIRLTKSGTMRISKPCSCCFNFLRSLNCKNIYFTTDLGLFAILNL